MGFGAKLDVRPGEWDLAVRIILFSFFDARGGVSTALLRVEMSISSRLMLGLEVEVSSCLPVLSSDKLNSESVRRNDPAGAGTTTRSSEVMREV